MELLQILNYLEQHHRCNYFDIVPGTYNRKQEWDIFFYPKNSAFKGWCVREKNKVWVEPTDFCSKEEFIERSIEYNLDLTAMQIPMIESIKTSIVLANFLMQDAVELLGPNIIADSIKESEEYADNLGKVIKNALKPKLKIIRGKNDEGIIS